MPFVVLVTDAVLVGYHACEAEETRSLEQKACENIRTGNVFCNKYKIVF